MMEHITKALHSSGIDTPTSAVQVIGVANDIIRELGFNKEAKATSFRDSWVWVKISNSAARAIIYRDREDVLKKINTRIKKLYNGPIVAGLRLRLTSEL